MSKGPWSEATRAAHAASHAAKRGPYAVQRSWPEGSVQGQLVRLLESQQISADLSALLWSLLGLIKAQELAVGLLASGESE